MNSEILQQEKRELAARLAGYESTKGALKIGLASTNQVAKSFDWFKSQSDFVKSLENG